MKVLNLDNTNLHELNRIVKSNLTNTKFRSLGEYKYLTKNKKDSVFDSKFVANITAKIEQHLIDQHYTLVLEAVLSNKAVRRLVNYAVEFLEFHDFEEKYFQNYSPYDYAKKAVDSLLNFGTLGTFLNQIKNETSILKLVYSNSVLLLHTIVQPVQKLNLVLEKNEVDFIYSKMLRLAKAGQHFESGNGLTLETNDYSWHITKTNDDTHLVFNFIQKHVALNDEHFYKGYSGTQTMLSLLKTALKANINVAIIGTNENITTDTMNFLAQYIEDSQTISVVEKFKKTRISDIYNKKSVVYWSLKERDIQSVINAPTFEADWLFLNEPSLEYQMTISSYAASHNVVATFKNTDVKGFPLLVQVEQGKDNKMYRITNIFEYNATNDEYRLLFEYIPFDDSFKQSNTLSFELSEYLRKNIAIPSTLKPLIQEKEIITSEVPVNQNSHVSVQATVEPKEQLQEKSQVATSSQIISNDEFFAFGETAKETIEPTATEHTPKVDEAAEDDFFFGLVGGK